MSAINNPALTSLTVPAPSLRGRSYSDASSPSSTNVLIQQQLFVLQQQQQQQQQQRNMPASLSLAEQLYPTVPDSVISHERSRVLILYTGGTIGMRNGPEGYAPVRNYLEGHLRTMKQFHDEDAESEAEAAANGEPGTLITPLSIYNKRIAYRIVEYDPLLEYVLGALNAVTGIIYIYIFF